MVDRAPPARWVAGGEAAAVFLSLMLYTWALRGRGPAVAGIVVVVLLSHWWRREGPVALGFRRANFGRCLRVVGPLVLAVGLLIVVEAVRRGGRTALAPWQVAAVFVGYCAWGLVQQWALNGYFVNRFAEAFARLRWGRQLAALTAALCFAAAHLPNRYLVGPTFVLGVLSALAYLRYRNLLVLGLARGVLGGLLVVYVAPSLPQGLRTGPSAARAGPVVPVAPAGAPRPAPPRQVGDDRARASAAALLAGGGRSLAPVSPTARATAGLGGPRRSARASRHASGLARRSRGSASGCACWRKPPPSRAPRTEGPTRRRRWRRA